ncbi:UNVERIFIED_CONTAM: hypothetical protein FKN15_011225 [Acipenser sinensis]
MDGREMDHELQVISQQGASRAEDREQEEVLKRKRAGIPDREVIAAGFHLSSSRAYNLNVRAHQKEAQQPLRGSGAQDGTAVNRAGLRGYRGGDSYGQSRTERDRTGLVLVMHACRRIEPRITRHRWLNRKTNQTDENKNKQQTLKTLVKPCCRDACPSSPCFLQF